MEAGTCKCKTLIVRNLIILIFSENQTFYLLFSSALSLHLIMWLLLLTNLVSHPHNLFLCPHLLSFPLLFPIYFYFSLTLIQKTLFLPMQRTWAIGCCFQFHHLNLSCPPAARRRSDRENIAELERINGSAGNGPCIQSRPWQIGSSVPIVTLFNF